MLLQHNYTISPEIWSQNLTLWLKLNYIVPLIVFQISEEFRRITSKDLLETFNASLDKYVPRLLRLYRTRKGALGQQMEDILDKLDEQVSDGQ